MTAPTSTSIALRSCCLRYTVTAESRLFCSSPSPPTHSAERQSRSCMCSLHGSGRSVLGLRPVQNRHVLCASVPLRRNLSFPFGLHPHATSTLFPSIQRNEWTHLPQAKPPHRVHRHHTPHRTPRRPPGRLPQYPNHRAQPKTPNRTTQNPKPHNPNPKPQRVTVK